MMRDLGSICDEIEIRNLHLRYCRGVDRMDWDLIRSCYHPDGVDDHGEFVGGIEAFIAYAQENLPTFLTTNHHVTNQLVEVQGDVAYAEHYGIAYHRLPAGDDGHERDWVANVRYIDRLERRKGQWRIVHRRSIVDSDRVDLVSASLVPKVQLAGRRDRSDPSYERAKAGTDAA